MHSTHSYKCHCSARSTGLTSSHSPMYLLLDVKYGAQAQHPDTDSHFITQLTSP